MVDLDDTALIVVDVQVGLEDPGQGRRDNPDCERNVASLISEWRTKRRPIVFVQHDSLDPNSPLQPHLPGNALKDVVHGQPDLHVTKSVNSAFYGQPDLHTWLTSRQIPGVVICGIQTNFCCETTARMAGNLGYHTRFVLDATHTFDLVDADGETIPAELLARVTAANLDPEFATVVSTRELIEPGS